MTAKGSLQVTSRRPPLPARRLDHRFQEPAAGVHLLLALQLMGVGRHLQQLDPALDVVLVGVRLGLDVVHDRPLLPPTAIAMTNGRTRFEQSKVPPRICLGEGAE